MVHSSEPVSGQFQAKVVSNQPIQRRVYRLTLEFAGPADRAFAAAVPGQFLQLDVSRLAPPDAGWIDQDLRDVGRRQVLLRRPFSLSDVTAHSGQRTSVEILYRIVGPGTLRMTSLGVASEVSVIGPLGRGFWVPVDKKLALLVAGGMGAPPLQYLAKVLAQDYRAISVVAFAGAKSADDLPFEVCGGRIPEQAGPWLGAFARYGTESLVATEDGSAGFRGLVTERLSQWLGSSRVSAGQTVIYTCGPEAMMAEVAKIADTYNMDCQASLERMMACGIGVCQSCAVECEVEGSSERIYRLCCEDGPVFDTKELFWNLQ
jgi:dihydroorotate dehydrogenase electron transfer subunit